MVWMIRVGIGFDAHGFTPDRRLVLGGVEVDHQRGLAGHSDADVLSHAVADALLGAAGAGDLGSVFPEDERWRGASSLDILAETARLLEHGGWLIANVDATLIAEAPRLAPHRQEMRTNIASALSIAIDSVSVKSTSTDGLGFAGRREGIAALAVALVTARAS